MAEYSFEEEKQKFLLKLETPSTSVSLEKYSIEIRSNKELILLLLSTIKSKNVYDLEYISDELKKDKDIFLLAATYNITSFYYSHEDLKKDEEFILELFKKDIKIISFINQELVNDEYFLWYINEIEKIKSNKYLSFCMNRRIFNELNKNPNYLDDFSPPVNYKPAKRN
jgi:hypothetical protein